MKRAFIIVLFTVTLIMTAHTEASARQAWAVVDADTGRLLDGSNEHVRLPIASLTKIWTAFTVLESGAPLGETSISPLAASAEGSSIYMEQGTSADVEGLLYGLMLRSGNDAAAALAEHAGGSMDGFVKLMNDQALLYGLNDTYFTNPSGLHDELHLSTAYETALMLSIALENKQFKEISTAKKYVYEYGGKTAHWANKHRLLSGEAHAVAGKTGFTKAAGRTLATYFEKDGKNIVVVTLNDGNDWTSHRDLSAKIFAAYKQVTVAKKGSYDILPGVTGQLESPLKLLLKKDEKDKVSHVVRIPRGDDAVRVGNWTVYFDAKPLRTVPVHLTQ